MDPQASSGPSPKNKILIIGGNHDTRSSFIQSTHQFKQKIYGKDLTWSSAFVNEFYTSKVTLETKYYSAEIEHLSLVQDPTEHFFSPNNEKIYRNHLESLKSHVDAIVLIDDEADETEQIKSTLNEFIETFVEASEPNLLLFITQSEEKIAEHRLEWLYDNGFEIVSLETTEETEQIESQYREKTGFARILEAFESNMWPNMVYKTDLRPKNVVSHENTATSTQNQNTKIHQNNPNQEADQLDLDTFENGQSDFTDIDFNPEMESIPPEVMDTLDSLMKSIGAKSTSKPTFNPNASNSTSKSKSSDKTTANSTNKSSFLNDDLLGEFDGEDSFGDLLGAFNKMKLLKEQASNLPDEQRRTVAAQVAMAFMNMLDEDMDSNFQLE